MRSDRPQPRREGSGAASTASGVRCDSSGTWRDTHTHRHGHALRVQSHPLLPGGCWDAVLSFGAWHPTAQDARHMVLQAHDTHPAGREEAGVDGCCCTACKLGAGWEVQAGQGSTGLLRGGTGGEYAQCELQALVEVGFKPPKGETGHITQHFGLQSSPLREGAAAPSSPHTCW